MCITTKELEQKLQEIRKYKAMAEEAEAIRRSLEAEVMILSILVDTFISKISLTMQPGPKIDSISGA